MSPQHGAQLYIPSGFSFWLSGEPNDFNGAEDCALAKEDGWNDDTCAKLFFWICEKVVVLEHLEAELKKLGP